MTIDQTTRRKVNPSGWADLYAWHVDRDCGVPLYRQVYQAIRSAILEQALQRGTKLPSTRALASRIGVSRASVIAAFEQLLDEGYIAGQVGSGSYVSFSQPEFPDAAANARVRGPRARTTATAGAARLRADPAEWTAALDQRAFNTGRTIVDARTIDTWRKLTNQSLRTLSANQLGYSHPCGLIELRKTIRDYLRAARSVRCDAEQVIVTSGTQQAIDITLRVLALAGEEVLVEDPGYPLVRQALSAAGIKARLVGIDGQGMKVAHGVQSWPRARAAFVTPSHQYPLGVVLSMARRLELLAWARMSHAWIIEDDYASEFRYSGRPLASLQGLDDADRVIYIGTLNKVLFPGLRLGYLVVPKSLQSDYAAMRYVMDRQPPILDQLVLARFMLDGDFTAHIRRTRQRYHEQRDTLVELLRRRLGPAITVAAPDQGIHLVAYLAQGYFDRDVERVALENGVIVRAISQFYVRSPKRSGIMLGFSGYPRQIMVPAVARLARAIQGMPSASAAAGHTRLPT